MYTPDQKLVKYTWWAQSDIPQSNLKKIYFHRAVLVLASPRGWGINYDFTLPLERRGGVQKTFLDTFFPLFWASNAPLNNENSKYCNRVYAWKNSWRYSLKIF